MKTLKASLRNALIGLGLLACLSVNGFADNYLLSAPTPTSMWNNGIIYSVPAGANYEWYVEGDAQILLGGGGLNVAAYGYSPVTSDVGSTAYADSISYQLNAYGSSGYAMFYLGW